MRRRTGEAAAKAPSWTEAGGVSEATPPAAKEALGPLLPRGQALSGVGGSPNGARLPGGGGGTVDNYPDKSHSYCVATVVLSSFSNVLFREEAQEFRLLNHGEG